MKKGISITLIVLLVFTALSSTSVFAASTPKNLENSFFLSTNASYIQNGNLQVTKNILDKGGAKIIEVKQVNGSLTTIRESTLRDGKIKMQINEGTKEDILVYNPIDNSYILDGVKVTCTSELLKSNNLMSASASMLATTSTKRPAPTKYVSSWKLKYTKQIIFYLGQAVCDVATVTILTILIAYTPLKVISSAFVTAIIGEGIAISPTWYHAPYFNFIEDAYVGTGSVTAGYYTAYAETSYFNSSINQLAKETFIPYYYKGLYLSCSIINR